MARHSGTHTSLAADLDVKSQHLLPTQSLRKHRDRQGLQMITVFSESSKVRLLAADSWKWKHENGNKVEKKKWKKTPHYRNYPMQKTFLSAMKQRFFTILISCVAQGV